VAKKANTADVYVKSETVTQKQVSDMVAVKANMTDVYHKNETFTQKQVTDMVAKKANTADVYVKSETVTRKQVSDMVAVKANMTDVYHKDETFTQKQVTDMVAKKANAADVYPKSDTFTQKQVTDMVAKKAETVDVYRKNETFTQEQVTDMVVKESIPVLSIPSLNTGWKTLVQVRGKEVGNYFLHIDSRGNDCGDALAFTNAWYWGDGATIRDVNILHHSTSTKGTCLNGAPTTSIKMHRFDCCWNQVAIEVFIRSLPSETSISGFKIGLR